MSAHELPRGRTLQSNVSVFIRKSMSMTSWSIRAGNIPTRGAWGVFTTAILTSKSEKVHPNVHHDHYKPCPVQLKPFHFPSPYAYGGAVSFHPMYIMHSHLPVRLHATYPALARAYGWHRLDPENRIREVN